MSNNWNEPNEHKLYLNERWLPHSEQAEKRQTPQGWPKYRNQKQLKKWVHAKLSYTGKSGGS